MGKKSLKRIEDYYAKELNRIQGEYNVELASIRVDAGKQNVFLIQENEELERLLIQARKEITQLTKG